MRSSSLAYAALAGLALGAFAFDGAGAMTVGSSSGVRAASEAVDVTDQVHCRPYRHHHRYHGWSRGCGAGEIDVRPGGHVRIEERDGVSRRTSIRSRTTTTRGETNVRSREGSETRSREGTSVRSRGSSDARGEVRTKSGSETGRTGGESSRSSGQSKSGASKGGETGQSPSNQQPTK